MRRSLKWQIILQIVLSITIVFTLIFTFAYKNIRGTLEEMAKDNARLEIEQSARALEKIMHTRMKLAESYASNIKYMYRFDDYRSHIDELTLMMASVQDKHVYGYWYSFNSAYHNQGKYRSWYGVRNGEVVSFYNSALPDDSSEQYSNDPDRLRFFGPKKTGRTYFTKPYIDPYFKEPIVSISTPVYDDNNELMGVAGLDIKLDDVQQIGAQVKIGKTGYAIIVTDGGHIFYHPDKTKLLKTNIYHDFDPKLGEIYANAVRNMEVTQLHHYEGRNHYFFSMSIPSPKWTAMVIVPQEEITGRLKRTLYLSILLFLVFLIMIYFVVHWWVTRSVTRPLNKVLIGTEWVAQGDLDRRIVVKRDNEFHQLAEKFNQMIESIRKNKELEQEMKRLSSLNLIGEMASVMGHEIRNPLNTISLLLHLLTQNDKYSEDRDLLQVMRDEANRADSIITEYLSLTSRKLTDFRATDLNEIVRNIYPLVQAAASSNKQSVMLDLKAIPPIMADNKEMRQLLHNLVRNGLEAMESGQQLWIRTRQDENTNTVKLTIEDQGQGIPSHILKQIGTPFLTTKENGTGLGLAICTTIIKRHGGDYRIETNERGTRFEVTFSAMLPQEINEKNSGQEGIDEQNQSHDC